MNPVTMMVGGQILSGLFGARSARKAAAEQAAATREGIASQERMFERGLELQEPFRQGGLEAQGMLMNELRNPSQYRASAGLSPAELAGERFNFEADPSYGFRLSEGLKALERSAAARGGLMSGGTGKALQRYGQDMASQEYGNAFQRFQQDRAARAGLGGMEYGQFAGERSARLLPLMQTVASGQGLTSNIASQMGNLGSAQAAAARGIGESAAAGRIGQANALMGGFGQGANLYMQNQFMNRYFGGGADPGVTRTVYTPGPPAFGSSAYESQYGMMP
jgi:hypothetical protein